MKPIAGAANVAHAGVMAGRKCLLMSGAVKGGVLGEEPSGFNHRAGDGAFCNPSGNPRRVALAHEKVEGVRGRRFWLTGVPRGEGGAAQPKRWLTKIREP